MVIKNSQRTVKSNKIHAQTLQGKIIAKLSITRDIEKIRIKQPYIAEHAIAGQFVNIKTGSSHIPLLRRPFSVNRANPEEGWFEILYRILGVGTKALAQKQVGDAIDLVGPLGNGFKFPVQKAKAVLVAGGLGIAPLEFLAQKLSERGLKSTLFWGNPNKQPFFYQEHFAKLGMDLHFATDDGSYGFRGNIVENLNSEFHRFQGEKVMVYACGPDAMLKSLKKFVQREKLKCQVSLETTMACGFGACMGCNVARADGSGYFYVCKDGPVFDIEEIELYE